MTFNHRAFRNIQFSHQHHHNDVIQNTPRLFKQVAQRLL
jgi:hypothetical protein